MKEELAALIKNNTWELVPPPPDRTIVGCKWIFKVKRNSDGSIARYKARLVAKGFNQRPGLDYTETFSPVIKPVTVRLVLCIAVSQNWPLHQLDVNNAFLQGDLSEEVYMRQPPAYADKHKPNYVCKLNKAIYGLKQAPRAWYTALSNFLLAYGFLNSLSDTSLFIYAKKGILAYMLVYVDDIIITGNNPCFISSFVAALSDKFSLKDLGNLNYFLGIEVLPTKQGLFLSQHKYITEILDRTTMSGAKESVTPLSTSVSLQLFDGSSTANEEQFRKIIGSLQYLCLTRPDINFAVNKLSQFMHKPTQIHFTALKRVLRYLKGTLFHGLLIKKDSPSQLLVYTDSDWAGNMDDRTSTSAYLIYLGGTPISWSSKKQKTIARSSTEAEYRAIAAATSELTWIQSILQELQFTVPTKPAILCDNLNATYTCKNPVFHTKMKHLALDFLFVREKVAQGLLTVHHIPTEHQLADLLTKPLSKSRFHFLLSKIGVTDGSIILRGDIGGKQLQSLS